MGKNEDRKGKHELHVLENALRHARKKGGEGRRNADGIAGEADPWREEPDLAITTSNGRIIGIEHFRVDHFIKGDKKAQSAAAELANTAESKRKQALSGTGQVALAGELIDLFGTTCSRSIQLTRNACADDLARSLSKRLFDKECGHAPKLAKYRGNLEELRGDASEIELGFLIEFHSDFRHLFLNDALGSRKPRLGELPMFPEVYDMLKEAAERVDWLILCFYGAIGGEMVDAAIVRCTKGMFRESMRRQGLLRTEYLGLGKSEPSAKQPRAGQVDSHIEEGIVNFSIANTSEELDPRRVFNDSIRSAALALNLARAGTPFAATLPTQMVYELLADSARSHKGAFSTLTVAKLLDQMSVPERELRNESFSKKWDI